MITEDLEKKLNLAEPMELETHHQSNNKSSQTIILLRRFLLIQQRRAQAYAKLKRGFDEYMVSGGELAYQQLCSEVTLEFNDCSKQVQDLILGFPLFSLLFASCIRSIVYKTYFLIIAFSS
uniref:Uncharacterized protein n=1 Tax=Manihot esculenta TaxID=3983 RepID=A0A2C9V546_MANES